MSLIIAGERSGVGKTTVTLALLAYLKRNNLLTQSFKVGPDYIDPMFHRYVTGRPCRNLDPVLTSEDYVEHCFAYYTQSVRYALIEGVMGLFDGTNLKGAGIREWVVEEEQPQKKQPLRRGGFGSTAHIARLLNMPILLVVDCSRLSHSIAALVHGYTTFDPSLRFAGLVLNRVGSDRHLSMLRSALAPFDIPILGVLRRHHSITIPDRHLGLVPTAELPELDTLTQQLANLAHTSFDWKQLEPLLQRAPKAYQPRNEGLSIYFFEKVGFVPAFLSVELRQAIHSPQPSPLDPPSPTPPSPHSPTPLTRIAIAQDAAFSFYYEDNLDLLRSLGAELVFWSPLQDEKLPDGVQGLIFGGGFPEMFAAQLTANESARQAVKQAIADGIPTYAECGGLMYLGQHIIDFEGHEWEMVGILPTNAMMGKQLTLGYRQVKTQQESVIAEPGVIAWGHEFHRSHLSSESINPVWQLNTPNTKEGWVLPNLHASYIHLHWGATPIFPKHFIERCSTFKWAA